MRSLTLASAAAALCLLAAPAAFARSPEAQAVSVFHATCVVGQGQSAAIDKTLAPLVAKQRASAVPMADFTKRTGLKADHAWVVMPGKGTQKLLVTTEPGLCAVHVAEGDGARRQAGDALKVHAFRRDELMTFDVLIAAPAADTAKLAPSARGAAQRRAWLGA